MENYGQLDRQEVIRVLTLLHAEWEEAAEGEPLEQVYGSVGLLLEDVMRGIGIELDEVVLSPITAD